MKGAGGRDHPQDGERFEVTVDGARVVGPVTLDQVRRGIEAGKLPPDVRVRRVGEVTWGTAPEVLAAASAKVKPGRDLLRGAGALRELEIEVALDDDLDAAPASPGSARSPQPTPPPTASATAISRPKAALDGRKPVLLGAGSVVALLALTIGGCVALRSWADPGTRREEIDRLIDQRLAARGIAALPSSSTAPRSSASGHATPAPRTDEPVAASTAFLARLDDLMKDYKPELPEIEDKSDVLRCVTTDAAKNNPEIGKAIASMRSQSAVAKEDRRRRAKEFYDTAYPLAFHVDYDWATRKTLAIPATYGCWNTNSAQDHTGGNLFFRGWAALLETKESCESYSGGEFVWRVKVPARPSVFMYSNSEAPPVLPEMMRRMEAAAATVPTRLSCRVDDVIAEQERRTIRCRSAGTALQIRTSAALAALNIGDVVSVPLADTRRDPDGVLHKNVTAKVPLWTADADAATVTVDSAAKCPSLDEIQSAVGDGGARKR